MTARAHAVAIELGRLYAMREQLDAVIETLENELDPPAEQACEHPADKRKPLGETMGSNAGFTCQQCGNTVTETTRIEPILDRFVRSGSTPGANSDGVH